MKMHRFLAASVLLLAGASSVWAQRPDIEITARAVRMEVTGTNPGFIDPEQDFTSEIEVATGVGLGVNLFLTDSISFETTVTLIESDLLISLFADDGPRAVYPNEMIPITLGFQYHVRPVRWLDLYAGAGGAYILFEDVDDVGNLAREDVNRIEIDDKTGFMANIGATFELRGSLGLNIDFKYLDVEPDVTIGFDRGDFVDERKATFDPVMISAGVAWRF